MRNDGQKKTKQLCSEMKSNCGSFGNQTHMRYTKVVQHSGFFFPLMGNKSVVQHCFKCPHFIINHKAVITEMWSTLSTLDLTSERLKCDWPYITWSTSMGHIEMCYFNTTKKKDIYAKYGWDRKQQTAALTIPNPVTSTLGFFNLCAWVRLWAVQMVNKLQDCVATGRHL